MTGGLVLAGLLIFVFGLALEGLDIRQKGSLTLWQDGPNLSGIMWIVVCVLGLFLLGIGLV